MRDPRAVAYEQLLELVEQLRVQVAELERIVVEQTGEIAELRRRLGAGEETGDEALVVDPVGAHTG